MSSYRDEMREVARESRWTFFRFLPLFAGAIIVLFIIGFSLNSLGLFGKTIVERKVFENSYQRSESLKAQIANDEAVLVEIRQKLSNPDIDANTRFNLEAQASAARVRISTAKSKQ